MAVGDAESFILVPHFKHYLATVCCLDMMDLQSEFLVHYDSIRRFLRNMTSRPVRTACHTQALNQQYSTTFETRVNTVGVPWS